MGKLIITIAPTGMIPTKQDTPHVPITPLEIIEDTYKAYRLGASIVHVHARDEQGQPTYKKEYFAPIFQGIRAKCPDMIICASTSGRFHNQVEYRAEVLELYPEMASLTLGSLNFPQHPSINSLETIKALAQRMKEHKVTPELEIFEGGFINIAKYLFTRGFILKPSCATLLLGSLGSIPASMKDLMYLIESLPPDCTWWATGIGRFQYHINASAVLLGGHVRVGIEDTIFFDHRSKQLATNPQLVRRIVKLAKTLNREIATPIETREMLGLN